MNELTTEIIAALARKQDLDEVFRHHLEIAINQLFQTELAEFLGYERYLYAGINTGNNRNGYKNQLVDTIAEQDPNHKEEQQLLKPNEVPEAIITTNGRQ